MKVLVRTVVLALVATAGCTASAPPEHDTACIRIQFNTAPVLEAELEAAITAASINDEVPVHLRLEEPYVHVWARCGLPTADLDRIVALIRRAGVTPARIELCAETEPFDVRISLLVQLLTNRGVR